jgi:hypothetical protein
MLPTQIPMRTLYILAFCLFFLPQITSSQEISNGPDNCATAEKFNARFAEVKKDALFTIASNSDCILMVQAEGSEVLSFDLSMNIDKSLVTENAKSGIFTITMQSRVGRAPAGTKVYIENIVVKGADGKVTRLKPVTVVM